jgi:hypothetical protein
MVASNGKRRGECYFQFVRSNHLQVWSHRHNALRLFACQSQPCPVVILLTIRLSEEKPLNENANSFSVLLRLCGMGCTVVPTQGCCRSKPWQFPVKVCTAMATDRGCRLVRTWSFQIASGPPAPRGKGILHAAVNKALSSLWSRSLVHTLRKTKFQKLSQTNENARHVPVVALRRPLVASVCGA